MALLFFLILTLSAALAPAAPLPNPYCGFLLSHADPVEAPVYSGHVLVFPPSLVGQAAFPIAGRLAGVATAGYSWILGEGHGGLASGLLRAEIARPTETRWGLVLVAGWIGGAAIVRGEGGGGTVTGLHAVASSPVRPWRAHAGAALHTMPGQAYDPGSGRTESYGFDNPQVSLFLSGEIETRRIRFRAETMLLGIGADEGWDSSLLALGGIEKALGRALLRVSAGVYVGSVGTAGATAAPVPVLVSVAAPFGGGDPRPSR